MAETPDILKSANGHVPIDTLTPHPSNSRQGDIGAISESLQHHGQYRPIVVQQSTRHIVAGNHTWKAAKTLGWDTISATLIDVDDEAALRILLVDNRTNDLATYDDHGLADLLVELAQTPQQLAGTGFDGDDLDLLIAQMDSDSERREDNAAEIPDNPITQLGDVWKLGNHTLTCGNSFEITLNGDVIVTDPPYGMRLDTDYTFHGVGSIPYAKHGTFTPVIGDDEDFDPSPLFERYAEAKEQFWFGADFYRNHLPKGGSWYVWDKRTDLEYDAFIDAKIDDVIGSHFELVWSRIPHKREIFRYVWSGLSGLQREDTLSRVHPTQKPVALMERIIKPTTGTVLDFFAGSGSTLIACENLDRVAHVAELEPAYCDVIIERFRAINPDATIQRIE